MTPAGGLFPGNSRRQPPPAPLATHLPSSSSSISSFSTLSPLAPPFTVDRPLPSSPPLSQLPPSTSSSTQILRPSVAGVPYRSRPGSGELVADAYYARYYPDLPPAVIDDSFKPSLTDYSGVGVGDPWNGPFDEEVGRGNGIHRVSSWMDPSPSYNLQPFQRGFTAEGHKIYEDDSHGSWNGKYPNSLAGKMHYTSESSDWLQDKHKSTFGEDIATPYCISTVQFSAPSINLERTSYTGLPRSSSGTESCNTFVPNSSYDRYMAQLDSCVSPIAFYPTTPCSTSSLVFSPSDLRATQMMDYISRNGSSSGHHVNTYKTGEPGNTSTKAKVRSIVIQDSESKEIDVKLNKGDNDIKNKNDISVDIGGNLPSMEKLSGSNATTNLELNPGLRLKGLPTPACTSEEVGNLIESSSEALDQLNLAVDSPCWKGAPASRQLPFAFGESQTLESKVCTDLTQDKENLEIVQNVGSLAEQLVANCHVINNKVSAEVHGSLLAASSSMHLKSKGESGEEAVASKHADKNDTIHMNVHEESMNELAEEKRKDSYPLDISSRQCGQDESSPAGFRSTDESTIHKKGSSSLSREHVKGLVKDMHKFSVDLLSTECNYDIDLEDHDLKLLRSTLNNILLVLEDQKVPVRNPHPGSQFDAACSSGALLNNDGMKQNMAYTVKGSMHTMRRNAETDEVDNLVSRVHDIDGRKVNDLAQAFESDLGTTFLEKEGKSYMQLYKNLWIEAEVEKCRLKYELQFTRMNYDIESDKHKSKGKSTLSVTSSSTKSTHDLGVQDMTLQSREGSSVPFPHQWSDAGIRTFRAPQEAFLAQESNTNESDDIEASVMARFKVLKNRKTNHDLNMNDQDILVDPEDGVPPAMSVKTLHDTILDDAGSTEVADLPRYLADLGFTESAVEPYAKDRLAAWSSFVRPVLNLQPPGGRYSDEPGVGFSTSGNAGVDFSRALEQSLSHKTRQGSWFPSVGSPSFEWEPATREEFM